MQAQALTQAVGAVVSAEWRAAPNEVHHSGGSPRQLSAVALLPPEVQAYAALDTTVNKWTVFTLCRTGSVQSGAQLLQALQELPDIKSVHVLNNNCDVKCVLC